MRSRKDGSIVRGYTSRCSETKNAAPIARWMCDARLRREPCHPCGRRDPRPSVWHVEGMKNSALLLLALLPLAAACTAETPDTTSTPSPEGEGPHGAISSAV